MFSRPMAWLALERTSLLATEASSFERLQDDNDKPLWVLAWGGINVLAQVLYRIHATFSEQKAIAQRSKLRVYVIFDQDDTGA